MINKTLADRSLGEMNSNYRTENDLVNYMTCFCCGDSGAVYIPGTIGTPYKGEWTCHYHCAHCLCEWWIRFRMNDNEDKAPVVLAVGDKTP